MKIGGYTRKVDELGRVVFPIEIRRKFKIEPGDQMRIFVEGGNILMRKDQDECALCGNTKNLLEINGKFICQKCLSKANGMNNDNQD